MRKFCGVLVLASAGLFISGCMSASNSVPGGGVPISALGTTATYDIIGDAVGTSSGAKLFGFIPIGCEQKFGQIAGGYPIMNPIARAAVYNAVESAPTADAILAPRFSTKSKNYVVFSEETVTVKGKAIRYNVSAK